MYNFTVIIVVVFVLWLAIFGAYIFFSRQQEQIAQDLDSLEQKLNETEKDA